MADGFLGRWSRRKLDVREGKPLDEPAVERPVAVSGSESSATVPLPVAKPAAQTAEAPESVLPRNELPPSMEDVKTLTPASDFTSFTGANVAPEVSNAAMKKLFADPHFNVMDRLDIYIDDYSKPDPLPAAMLRQMASAKFLKLFDDEEEENAAHPLKDDANTHTAQSVAESGTAPHSLTDNQPDPQHASQTQPLTKEAEPVAAVSHPFNPEDHANTDLRLQQDHAAGAEGPRRGAQ